MIKHLANVTQRQAVNFAVCVAGAVLPSWWPIVALPLILAPLNAGAHLETSGIATSLCAAVAIRCFGAVVRAATEMGAAFAVVVVLHQLAGTPGPVAQTRKPPRKKRGRAAA